MQGKFSFDLENWRIRNERASKDKTPNSKGRASVKMLDNCNMIILNGRSVSDLNGEYTRIPDKKEDKDSQVSNSDDDSAETVKTDRKPNSPTVIDYIAISRRHLKIVHDFHILQDIKEEHKSDHHPLVLTIDASKM
uniref:Endonuclease/exonuclease/phosphatase domain-containing protein n=1 Tax=Bracon brevicornis TaxID=1563983 RepID=A0A6V7HNZ7_9HYME